MFDSLKKKFADTSGKLRNKVENEAKEENNVELIEESSEETFDEIDESEELESFDEEVEELGDSKELEDEEIDFVGGACSGCGAGICTGEPSGSA